MNRRMWILWRVSSFLFHLLISLIFVYSLVYHEFTRQERFARSKNYPNPEPEFFGDWKYLTRWNFTIETIVFTICMVVDVILLSRIYIDRKAVIMSLENSLEKPHPIQRFMDSIDTLIFSLAFPLAIFVTITYWGLYLLDPGNVNNGPIQYPKLNHVMHTGVGIAILIEMILTYHRRPRHEDALVIVALFNFVFLVWVFFVHYKTDFWLYPIFGKLSPVFRGLFLAGSSAFFFALYFLGHFLQNVLWTQERIIMFLTGSVHKDKSEINLDLVNYKNREEASPS